MRQVLLDLPGPISSGGALAPISWTSDGWPVLQTVNGRWGTSYPYPNVPRPPRQVKPMIGTDTLTHRIQGPTSTATIELDYSAMANGDRAGLAMLRDSSAWIGVKRDNGAYRVVMTTGPTMDSGWNTTGTGTEQASTGISGGRIWLRVNADIRPGSGRQARFSYSTNGTTFSPLGPAFTLNNAWQFFMGYRYGIFNYASQSLGGAVTRAPLRTHNPVTASQFRRTDDA